MRAGTFLKKTATYGLGNLLLQASGFILLPIYTRALSPAEFGTLEVLNRVADILILGLMVGGIRQGVLAFYNQGHDEEERKKVVGTSMALMMALAALGLGSVLVVAGPLSRLLQAESPALLELAVLSGLLEILTLVPLALIQARIQAATFVLVTFTQLLVKVGLAIFLVVGLELGIWGVLIASATTSGLYAVVLTARECAGNRPRLDGATGRAMIRFAWPFLPTGLCFFLLNFGDRFFLLHYADPAQVGLYAIGYRLAMVVGLFSRLPLQMVWAAQMYEAAREENAGRIFGQMFTRILAVYVFVGLGVCLLQDEVILVLCGRSYAAAAAIIAPVVVAYFFLAAADLMEAGLFVRRQTRRKAGVALASAGVMLGLYGLLIPGYAALGAALATLGGFAFHALLTFQVSRGVFPVRYETRRLAALLGWAIALWLMGRGLPPTWWATLIRIVFWASWPAALWVGGWITPDEKEAVRAMARSVLGRFQPAAMAGAVENS